MDENLMANVVGCYLGKSYDEEDKYRCEIMMAEEDKENKMYKMTRVVASQDGTETVETVEIKKPESFSVEITTEDKLYQEMKAYFSRENK
jgi:hypothetical protein